MTAAIRWTPEQLAEYQRKSTSAAVSVPEPAKPRKYRNEPTIVDGLRFDSKHEAAVYQQLRVRELAGEIRGLRLQVPFACVVNGIHLCDYVADFVFVEGAATVVIDAKSDMTRKLPLYRLKRRAMQACHQVEIREL